MSDPAMATALPWILVGAGGHARSVADVIVRRGEELHGIFAAGGPPAWLPPNCQFFAEREIERFTAAGRWLIAIGDRDARHRLTHLASSTGHQLGVIVAGTATVSPDAVLEPGVMVLEHAHVGPGVELGASTIVNTSAVVEHESRVGGFSHIAPRAVVLGGAQLGQRVVLGAGAVVLPGLSVADHVVVGAGAVITSSVEPGVTVVGVPARVARRGSTARPSS